MLIPVYSLFAADEGTNPKAVGRIAIENIYLYSEVTHRDGQNQDQIIQKMWSWRSKSDHPNTVILKIKIIIITKDYNNNYYNNDSDLEDYNNNEIQKQNQIKLIKSSSYSLNTLHGCREFVALQYPSPLQSASGTHFNVATVAGRWHLMLDLI